MTKNVKHKVKNTAKDVNSSCKKKHLLTNDCLYSL